MDDIYVDFLHVIYHREDVAGDDDTKEEDA
jgi:hypothetical protein